VINLWVGDSFGLSKLAVALFGVYFAMSVWRHVNQVLALGLNNNGRVALVVLAEFLAVVGLGYVIFRSGNSAEHVYAMISVVILITSAWMFPLIYARSMKRARISNHHRDYKANESSATEAPLLQEQNPVAAK
ncbi:MAG: hypothetical protein AAF226_10685, partial [Verrucomicrobiota bacterium]